MINSERADGAYQTPPALARQVCFYLYEVLGLRPSVVVEPTCGVGHLIEAALKFSATRYLGIELNADYVEQARTALGADARVRLVQGDILATDVRALLGSFESLLILGNPPWVNRATRGALGAAQCATLSARSLGLRGIDAITGASNFDLSLAIMLKLAQDFRDCSAVMAMLCKISTARALLCELKRQEIPFARCALLEFDAKKHFGVDTGACLMVLDLRGAGATGCELYHLDQPTQLVRRLEFVNGALRPCGTASSLSAWCEAGADAALVPWRSGLKHDCAKVMELIEVGSGLWRNGLGEVVALESDYVFPLVKSSHIKNPVITTFRKAVVVPQRKLREDTAHLRADAPLVWQYLDGHRSFLARRKSSIYRGAPEFSLFGLGDYSFARYKVALSGFYYEPRFALLADPAGRPVMLDDTCYFLPAPSFEVGYALMLLLNCTPVQEFLRSLTFADAKRPYTQKLLGRLDVAKVAARLPCSELSACEARLDLRPRLTFADYQALRAWLGV